MHAELIFDARNEAGASPIWSVVEQALYWVDIPERRLHRWSAVDSALDSWQAEEMLGGIARCAARGNGWIAGLQSGVFELRPVAHGKLATTRLAAVEHTAGHMRFNEGRCDRQGRFWASTMHLDTANAHRVGALYRYSVDIHGARLVPYLQGFIVPNGLAFSPDGRTMYLSDSHPIVRSIWTFDYDIDAGIPHNRRLLVDLSHHSGCPDGAAVDEDGCYWSCGHGAGVVYRFTPDGRLDRTLELPVKNVTMCAFGGANLDTLFVTSARALEKDLHDQPLAGGLFAVYPGVKGLEEPAFQG
ncbi:SMP-30/gluconolactonase/LRE family protein [Azomonas macrocytogenes]|uniref:Sugar lactone lactonase YvrE n=1 Tax=Azomonas macrocytogenes TaxID=69962 RepID=A0A839T473_AZOMA|nr:SMP-30/gluconolactonase/LRE family protein [Azomonas macrocytogenes]MBB3103286.1 sugar lactone lactonase YvrE [Azomonas macrocytogenes]